MIEKWIIGIDPGLSGAISCISTTLGLSAVFNIPKRNKNYMDEAEVMGILNAGPIDLIVIEKQQQRPGQGLDGGTTMMRNYGALLALSNLASQGKVIEILPQEWQHPYLNMKVGAKGGLVCDLDHTKEDSIKQALFFCPVIKEITVSKTFRADHAESFLIGLYGVRKLLDEGVL